MPIDKDLHRDVSDHLIVVAKVAKVAKFAKFALPKPPPKEEEKKEAEGGEEKKDGVRAQPAMAATASTTPSRVPSNE